MTEPRKPTDAYDLCQLLFRMFRATDALCEVVNHYDVIGCDRNLMEEFRKELWTAIHDDIREFEDSVRKDENEKCCKRILTALKAGGHIRGNFALTDLMEFAR